MPEAIQTDSKAGQVAVGHPVDVSSGAVFTIQHDFEYPGMVALDWQRRYTTASDYMGILGRGWSVPYLMRLEVVEGAIELFDDEGGTLRFPTPSGPMNVGDKVASFGANMELLREDDRFVVIHWHYGSDQVLRFHFLLDESPSMPLAAVENLLGHRLRLDYDAGGRLMRLTQEIEERVVELAYGDGDLLAAVYFLKESGERKRIASYRYDDARNLVAFSDALGGTTTYAYDRQHRMTAETNCLGSTFRFEYDDRGRCVYSSGDDGYMARRLQYFSAPPMTRVTDSLGHTIDYFFNRIGMVIQELMPIGGPWSTEYDAFGREITQTDPLGASVRYGYDDWGNRCSIVDENGAETRLAYDERHVLQAFTDAMGSTWRFEHDRLGNVIAAIDPLGGRQAVVRDPRGFVTTTVTAAGREIVRRYGHALRWVEVEDQIASMGRQEFDDEGNEVAAYDAVDLVRRVRFDACHQPLEIVDRVGNAYCMEWNLQGQLTARSGPDIGWEQRDYDRFGQLVRHVNPIGEMHFRYDTEGRMTEACNRVGERMRFAYDAEGRKIATELFDGRVERCEFNAVGKVVRLPMADGRDVEIRYDPAGNVIGRQSSDGLIEKFTFDRNGDLIKAETADTLVELVRNALGLVVAEVQNGHRIDYLHDADGHRTGRRMPAVAGRGAYVERRNDVRGRMTSLHDAGGLCQALKWDDVDRLVERSFPGGVEDMTYDGSGRLKTQRIHSFGAIVVERAYAYDPMDNIRAVDEREKRRREYGYDTIGRLLTASVEGRIAESYQYDANGTITESHRGPRVLAPGGRTLHGGQRTYVHDLNGCVTKIVDPDRELDLSYDVDGRLVEASTPGGMATYYTYDALGRRTSKLVDGERTDFLWDGFVLAAQGREGKFDQAFVFHALDPVAQWHDGEHTTPVTDQAGMVREVFDAHGNIVWQASIESYGLLASEAGDQPCPLRLRGQYLDVETGLHYNFHRSYDPWSGNYLSPDPIGIEGGANFYAFPRNPLLWDDPYGLSCKRRSCKAEAKMTAAMKVRGYTLVSSKGKSVMANGIDGIYHNPNGKPPYIIAEAKSGCAVLRWSGPKDASGKGTVQQMSDAWINGKPGASGESRLESALPPTSTGAPNPHLVAIQSAPANSVGREVYNPEKSPTTRTLPNYGGIGSPTKTI